MRILIVGSLDGYINAASKLAIDRGAKVSHTETIDRALNMLRSGRGAELVMIDVKLEVGLFIGSLKSERIFVPVVACGIGNDTGAAVNAIKAGAKEYLPLPPNAELIAAVLEAVSEESQTIIFRDPAMAEILRLAEQFAPSEASILITGESGTGKELLARFVHKKSRRADRKFVCVNCAAIPETLLESELFGHEKGAFTGAIARRIGKFEEADGGTLLLDEISEMDPHLQAKLLRTLQEREIDRVGGTQPVKIDIRLVATANRDLEEEIRKGRFREDLLFRLNVMTLSLPPLNQRPLDIEILADHFTKKYTKANGLPPRKVSKEALALLQKHVWRGNVREIENTMHRAVLLANGTEIGPEAILLSGSGSVKKAMSAATDERSVSAPVAGARAAQPEGSQTGIGSFASRTVADVERDLIIDTLNHCLGNRTHAANILGISIRTLRNKLKQYSEEGMAVPLPGEATGASV